PSAAIAAIVSDLPANVKPSVLQVSNPFGTKAKDFHLQSDPQVRASIDSLAGFAAQDCTASQAATSVMFPEIFKALSARGIQKPFPIRILLGHELERLLLLGFLSLTESKRSTLNTGLSIL
ncbi:unnamed protein product, partial [Brassica napus]